MQSKKKGGFTLIELLIVVAIIAILAAIAVPNFVEAQVRSKVSRAKSDMRSTVTAIEAYHIDANSYPPDGDDIDPFNPANFNVAARLSVITTPIAYITSLPPDPFHVGVVDFTGTDVLFPGGPPFTYIYNTWGNFSGELIPPEAPANRGKPDNYTLTSLGPSGIFDSQFVGFALPYDPTNGSVSMGDIHLSGGNPLPF